MPHVSVSVRVDLLRECSLCTLGVSVVRNPGAVVMVNCRFAICASRSYQKTHRHKNHWTIFHHNFQPTRRSPSFVARRSLKRTMSCADRLIIRTGCDCPK